MSFRRAKSRKINESVYFQNKSAVFLTPPMHTGDLVVNNNESIGKNLTIGQDLTIGGSMHATNYYASGNYYLNNYVLIPAGTIIQSAAIAEPAGWYECDGRSLDIYTFAELFTAIGYTYGGYSPSFNIPDMRGRVGIGVGSGYGLASTGGDATHTLTTGEMPSHTHTSNSSVNSNGLGAGLIVSDGNNTQNTDVNPTTGEPNLYANPIQLAINNTGGGGSHNNMQPYVVLRYLIKI